MEDGVTCPMLQVDLERLCINIVKHIQLVTAGNVEVRQMELIFKVGSDSRVWLLYCNSMKTSGGDNLSKAQSGLRISVLQARKPPSITSKQQIETDLTIKHDSLRIKEQINKTHCNICLQKSEYLCQISLKTLIPRKSTFDDPRITKMLIRLWDLPISEIIQNKMSNDSWLSLKVSICGVCFVQKTSKKKIKASLETSLGLGNILQNRSTKRRTRAQLSNRLLEKSDDSISLPLTNGANYITYRLRNESMKDLRSTNSATNIDSKFLQSKIGNLAATQGLKPKPQLAKKLKNLKSHNSNIAHISLFRPIGKIKRKVSSNLQKLSIYGLTRDLMTSKNRDKLINLNI